MQLPSVLRRALTAALAMVAVPAVVHAQAIAYTFSGTTSLFGGLHSYEMSLTGDVSNVVDFSESFYAAPNQFLLNLGLQGTLTLDGTTAPLSTWLDGYSFGVGALNGTPFVTPDPMTAVGFMALNPTTGGLFGLVLPMARTYDLASNVGPVSATAFEIGGWFNPPTTATVASLNNYPLVVTTATPVGPTTFEAQVTATPEPASLALVATGLVALGGVAVRRRRDRD